MDLKANNIWDLVMSIKMIDSVSGFSGRDISAIGVSFDFVTVVDFKGGKVRSLLDVFEKILERSKGSCAFDIDMAVEGRRKIWAIWYYPSVVNPDSSNKIRPPIIRTEIDGKAMFIHSRKWGKGLRKSLCAFAIFHAWCIRVSRSTWAMYHASHNGFKKKRLCFRVRPSSPDAGVNCICCCEFIRFLQKD